VGVAGGSKQEFRLSADGHGDGVQGDHNEGEGGRCGCKPLQQGEGEAVRRMKAAGYVIGNLDATLILQRPKLSPHKEEIRANLCELLEAGPSVINLKAADELAMDGLPKLATSLRFLSIAKYSS
jgi:2-C-methyl-D-erythritol 2,4-cyclodiphosphate synthase